MTEPIQSLDPRLTASLNSLRRRVKRLAWLHGMGTWLALCTVVFVGSFYLDRVLNPPHTMRLVVAPIVWLACIAGFAWFVVRRARVKITNEDAALLVERNYPELKERLISAVQLVENPRDAAPEFVNLTVREGEEAAMRLEFGAAVKSASARLWFFAGALGVASTATLALREPADTKVFLQRLLGMATEFPQRTRLDLDVPSRGTNLRVKREGDVITVRIARGSDLTARVLAEGVAPPIVELVTSEGRRIPMGQTGGNEYLARFHAVKSDFQFHAEGGDDRDESPRVMVETVTPPAISKIRVKVTPPAYAPQPPFEREGGSIEALVGSRAEILVETMTPVKVATLRFRGGEDTIAFRALEVTGDATSTNATRFMAELSIDKNARYSVELEDAEGLRNPDPGSYSIVALTDRAPEVKLQAPARTEVDLAPGGSLSIQARATDDFGVVAVRLKTRADARSEFTEQILPLTTPSGEPVASMPSAEPAVNSTDAGPKTVKSVIARTRLDVASLRVLGTRDTESAPAEHRAPAERDVIEFFVEAADTRSPKAGLGESLRIRAVVLSPSEILKRITERFSRARDTVQSLLDIQNERKRRVAELITALSTGDVNTGLGAAARQAAHRSSLTSILVGQNRVTTDSRVLSREFFESVESAASNRLDRTGEAVSGALDRLRSSTPAANEDPYSAEIATALVAQIRSGSLGSPEFLGKLGEMLHEAARVATEYSPGATSDLDAAMLAFDNKPTLEALERTLKHQDSSIQSLERLLGMLAEWANFQDVITLTKEILDQQKTLEAKTKESATGKSSK